MKRYLKAIQLFIRNFGFEITITKKWPTEFRRKRIWADSKIGMRYFEEMYKPEATAVQALLRGCIVSILKEYPQPNAEHSSTVALLQYVNNTVSENIRPQVAVATSYICPTRFGEGIFAFAALDGIVTFEEYKEATSKRNAEDALLFRNLCLVSKVVEELPLADLVLYEAVALMGAGYSSQEAVEYFKMSCNSVQNKLTA